MYDWDQYLAEAEDRGDPYASPLRVRSDGLSLSDDLTESLGRTCP
jgi:hypothetical protein